MEQDVGLVAELFDIGNQFPVRTENVYRLAATMADEISVKKIFQIKQKPTPEPLIAHMHQGIY